MTISDFVDTSRILIFFLWVLIPLAIVVKNYLCRSFFLSVELGYLFVSIFSIGYYENIFFSIAYVVVIVGYIFWWGNVYKKFRDDNPGQYEMYLKYFSEYYGDDLNNDGIKDAFENWQIAHDPRFFWIFGSRMAKSKRRMERDMGRFESLFRSKSYANYDEIAFQQAMERRNRRYSQEEEMERAQRKREYERRQYESYASQGSNQNAYYNQKNGYGGGTTPPPMSEEERKVAKQHAFARQHNLRYFAMCESKSDAKKLYRKYASKFHPDNPVTGDKEKFIAIDEEYNRFCAIDGIV